MLKGNTVLITGGASGVGLELARQLLENNNHVLICGRSAEKLKEAKQELPSVEIFQCDISKEQECIRLLEWVKNTYPSCNILINNAAIAHHITFETDDDAIRKAEAEFQINVLGPMRLSKLFLPLLVENTNAYLINITTGLVYAPRMTYPFYNATKAALHSFTQVLRAQLRRRPVKIVEVLLPVVATPWHHGQIPKSAISAEQAVKEMLRGINNGQQEVRVGLVKLLYWLVRIAPGFALGKVNSMDREKIE